MPVCALTIRKCVLAKIYIQVLLLIVHVSQGCNCYYLRLCSLASFLFLQLDL
jgi:hypothetical protein